MALALVSIDYDGPRCKIFTVSYLDNDAPADLAVAFTTPMQGSATPLDCKSVIVLSAADTTGRLSFKAISPTGVTVRKVTPAGAMGADAKRFRCTVRYPRGIAA